MSQARVSVIIPTYNSREFIEQTVSALVKYLASRDGAGELIVVDDGSTDGTGELLEKIARGQTAVKLIRYQRNRARVLPSEPGWQQPQASGSFSPMPTWLIQPIRSSGFFPRLTEVPTWRWQHGLPLIRVTL